MAFGKGTHKGRSNDSNQSPTAKKLQDMAFKALYYKKRIELHLSQYAQAVDTAHWELEGMALTSSSKQALLATLQLHLEEVKLLIEVLRYILVKEIPSISTFSEAEFRMKASLIAITSETLRLSTGSWRQLSRICSTLLSTNEAFHAIRERKELLEIYQFRSAIAKLYTDICTLGDLLFSARFLQRHRSELAPAIHAVKHSLQAAAGGHSVLHDILRFSPTESPIARLESTRDIIDYLRHVDKHMQATFRQHSFENHDYKESMMTLIQVLKQTKSRGRKNLVGIPWKLLC